MSIRKDIATDYNTGDLMIKNNDFFFGESDEIHIQDTIIANPGDWKEFPIDGCSLIKYVNSDQSSFNKLSRKIIIELNNDGYDVSSPIMVDYL
jgi:hypothetical protein